MTEEHNLVLILARGLAQSIATPMFIVDPDGTLVYFNEPAERILGTTYAKEGEMNRDEWATAFDTRDPSSGEAVDPSELPLAIAVRDRKAGHRTLDIAGRDGVRRQIGLTAFPLFARTDEFVGAIAIFWEEG